MILIILLIALILRLVSINQSLWLDEAINVNVARSLEVKRLILEYALGDFHPPLYHIILKYWIDLFGFSEISVRIPSIIFAIGTIYFTYLIAKKLFEQKTAFIAATLVATAPLHIYYSQEARMYMAASFFVSLSVYFFISILKKDTLIFWLGFILSTTLTLYTDYVPYLLIPTYFIYLLFNRARIPKGTLRSFAPAFLLIFILILPWLVIFPKQLSTGLSAAAASPAWAQVVGGADIKSLLLVLVKFTIGRISHENNLIYFLLFAPLGLFVGFLFMLSLFRASHIRSILYYWLAAPILLGFLTSFLIPIFAYFRFIFLLPAFYTIWASAINTVNWTPLVRALLVIALAINLISTTIYFINPQFHRENWKEATRYVISKSTPATIILFESNYTAGPFDYYNNSKVPAFGALTAFNAQGPAVNERIKSLTEGKNEVYLFQYLSQITDPSGIVFTQLTRLGFTNTSTRDFTGVGFVYEFQR